MLLLFLFSNHISYYISYLGMNYNNVIGFLLFIIFIIQFVSGILLSCYYSDYYNICFDSVIYITIDVNIGWFIRFLHVIGVSLFILFIFIHLIRGIWIKFKIIYLDSIINIIWVTGLLLLSLSLIEGFLGYILLWGQMSYWGITVILNVLSIIPYFGPLIISLIWCSSQIIVYRVFIFHFFIGILIGLLILLHILIIHSFTNSNPFISSNSSIIIPFYPLIYKDLFVLFSILLYILSFILYWEPDILGNSDNLILANPLSTPHNILPEWYYLCFHCCLRVFPDKTIGFIIVLLFFISVL
jgi:ubiquinol-cytochrome c reductase cytochrome b subunit